MCINSVDVTDLFMHSVEDLRSHSYVQKHRLPKVTIRNHAEVVSITCVHVYACLYFRWLITFLNMIVFIVLYVRMCLFVFMDFKSYKMMACGCNMQYFEL